MGCGINMPVRIRILSIVVLHCEKYLLDISVKTSSVPIHVYI
jgi:hypothetical protein